MQDNNFHTILAQCPQTKNNPLYPTNLCEDHRLFSLTRDNLVMCVQLLSPMKIGLISVFSASSEIPRASSVLFSHSFNPCSPLASSAMVYPKLHFFHSSFPLTSCYIVHGSLGGCTCMAGCLGAICLSFQIQDGAVSCCLILNLGIFSSLPFVFSMFSQPALSFHSSFLEALSNVSSVA